MTNKQIVRDFYRAWQTGDESLLYLHEDFQHHSKQGSFTNLEQFMEVCWGKLPAFHATLLELVEEGDRVVIWYRWENEGMPICEWFRISDGLITEIRVFTA